MKTKLIALLLFAAVCEGFGQAQLQEVITDYAKMRSKNKVVTVEMPTNGQAAFYRITTFNSEKVEVNDALQYALRITNFDTLALSDSYNFSKHNLTSTALGAVNIYFFTDAKNAEAFRTSGKTDGNCGSIESTKVATGRLMCKGKMLFVGLSPTDKGEPLTAKVEIVGLVGGRNLNIYDRYPFSVQNETNAEVVYEISGDRTNWDTFHVPSLRKADFKLASQTIYLRVSTREKITEEYVLQTGKKYKLYWDEEKFRVNLGEIDKKIIK
jgi:hypothetical protein